MSGRRKEVMDVREIVVQMRAGVSDRQIAKGLQISRNTVKRYRGWAQEQGLLAGTLPDMAGLQALLAETLPGEVPPQQVSSVEPYRELVLQMRQAGVEIAAIWQRLGERGYAGSYQAVWRFVQQLEPKTPAVTVRIETKPGEEAQVDFGYAGRMLDPATGQLRKSWAFVMTLSWSRHQYVEFVFDQKVETWLRLHRNAFTHLGGVPERVVIDNLKAAIVRACWEDPLVQQAYRECAEHYGFRIAPCRPATPQHKGKVESGVHYVKRNFLGGREATTLTQANRDVQRWCEETAGQRCHGTTKEQPMVRFAQVEQAHLQSLPEIPYDLAVWKEAKLHRDGHVIFEKAYYSAPYRLVDEPLRIRGGGCEVRIYTQDYQLVATHERASEPGQRQTHPDHLPPDLVAGVFLDRESCQRAAQDIGPATARVVEELLADVVVERLPVVRRLLKLREAYADRRLEAACARALTFGDGSYMTIKRILQRGQESEAPVPEPIRAPARAFVRTATELVGHLWGGVAWN
jgi:transposase